LPNITDCVENEQVKSRNCILEIELP